MTPEEAIEILGSRILLDTRMCSSDEVQWQEQALIMAQEALKTYRPNRCILRRIAEYIRNELF